MDLIKTALVEEEAGALTYYSSLLVPLQILRFHETI